MTLIFDNIRLEKRQHARYSLCDKGGPGHSRHPHFKATYKNQIQYNVADGGTDEEIQWCTRIAKGVIHACANVIKKKKCQAANIYVQIERAVGKDIFRSANQSHHGL